MASVNGPHWREDRNQWCLQWRWNGTKEHLEVSVTALDGDKDAAKRVAERVKEHVGSTGGERADFITFVDQCIAEMVETQSLSEVVSAAYDFPMLTRSLIWSLYCLIATYSYRISILPKCSLQCIVFASALPLS